MTLSDLYPASTPLREVHPDFCGMPYRQWLTLKMKEQAEAYRATLNPADAPILRKAPWTPRDDYGMKGMPRR